MSKSTVRNQPALESLESRLLLTGGIEGTVFNALTSQPVDGITVTVFQSSNPDSANDEAWDWAGYAQTDSLGQYQVSGLNPRHYRLQIGDGDTATDGTHFVEADLFDVVVFDGATTTGMDIQARQAGRITGYVYDGAGNPIAGAQVLVEVDYTQDGGNDWHWSETDVNGQYDLYLVATTTKIYPVQILYAPAAGTSSDGHQNSYAAQIAPGLYSAPLAGTAGPDFHLSLGGTIHGFLMTADGDPVAYHDVVEPVTPIANGLFEPDNAGTDSNGEFWMDGVPAGTDIYLYTADWDWRDFSSNGHMYAQGERYVGPYNVAAGQVLDIGTFTVPRAGTIRGVVTDATGNPIVGAQVWFTGIDANGGGVWLNDEDGLTTDALGQYRCDWLPPGQYTVQVLKDGWVTYVNPTTITVTSDQLIQQDVVLLPSAGGVQVSGAITNFTDFAPKNSDGVVLPFNIADYDGYPIPTNGPSGPLVLAYNSDRQWTTADMIQPDRNFTSQAEVTDGYDDYFLTSSTPAGLYTMTLPTGRQTVQAVGPATSQAPGAWWSALFSDPVIIDGQAGQSLTDNLTIPQGTATISGDITFPALYGNGGGVISSSSMWVFLRPVTADTSFFGRAVGQPDPAGHFVLDDIPAGNYYLYSYGLGLTPWVSGLVTVTAGQAIVQNVAMSYGGVVSGTVTADGAPLAGAAVSSRNTGFSIVTDANGDYQLPGFLVGGDTLTVSKAGLVPQSVDITLAADEHKTQNIDLASNPSSITGMVEQADTTPVNGASVVAYDTVTGQQTWTTTVAGQFTFTGLASSLYVLGVHADGMTTATYPGGAGTITLDPATAMDLPAPIILSYVGPSFSVSSSVAAGTLSITFHTDMPLNAMPTATLVSGAGVLGSLSQADTTTYTCAYTAAAGESLARISIAEDATDPIVTGSPVSQTFGFDVAATLVEQQGTTFYNAQGASEDMMGAQDNSTVYIPPFALVGSEATSAITLTATRYGDPGAQLGDARAVTGVYDFSFSKDGQAADVQLAHQATVTLSFKLPANMTPAEFEATLKVGFNNKSLNPPAWVWNDLANSNPASEISNISINWASSTITFKASHFSEFAAAVGTVAMNVVVTKSVSYIDADGTAVKLSISRGSASVDFTGDNIQQQATTKGVTVTGDNLAIAGIDLSGTVSKLSFSTRRGTIAGATVGEITGDAVVGSLSGKTIDLVGDGIVLSGGYIGSVVVRDLVDGADIRMPGAGSTGLKITARALAGNNQVVVGSPIKSLTAAQWTSGLLEGPYAASVTMKGQGTAGAFGADVNLTAQNAAGASLANLKVAGDIQSVMVLAGTAKSIAAANWVGGSLSAVAMDKLAVKGGLSNVTMVLAGTAKSIAAANWVGGSLSAVAMDKLAVKGDMSGVTLNLSRPYDIKLSALGKATIGGWLQDSRVLTVGNMKSLTVGGLRNTDVFAAVLSGASALPDPATDLAAGSEATIKSLTVKGTVRDANNAAMSNFNIAAPHLGVVKAQYAWIENGGEKFGFATHSLKGLRYKDADGPYKWPNSDPDDAIAPQGNGDLEFRVV